MALSFLVDRLARLVVVCVLASAGTDLGFCAHCHDPIGGPAVAHLQWRANAGPSHGHSRALDYGSCFCHGIAVAHARVVTNSPFVPLSGLDRDSGASLLATAPALVDHPPPSLG